MKKEKWKKIPGFDDRYEASNMGRLRSNNYKLSGRTVILKPALTNGYLRTMLLTDSGKYKTVSVHSLICLAWIGERNGLEINHIDGNPQNNRLDNLEYCTRSENMKHAYKLGLEKPMRGSLNGNSKLTESQVKELKEAKRIGGRFWGRNAYAKKFGVNEKHIQEIVNSDRLWIHV